MTARAQKIFFLFFFSFFSFALAEVWFPFHLSFFLLLDRFVFFILFYFFMRSFFLFLCCYIVFDHTKPVFHIIEPDQVDTPVKIFFLI